MEILPEDRKKHSLSVHQKAALLILIVVGFVAFGLGIASFSSSAKRPFLEQLARYAKAPEYLSQSQREEREVSAMRTRDTDEDKLMDYDEVFVYKTSPFLADSDSDGFDDATELFSGNDPNCPTGKDCIKFVSSGESAANAENPAAASGAGAGTLVGTAPEAPKFGGLIGQDANISSPEDLENYFASFTPEQIRAALRAAGVPDADLEKVSDADLRKLFERAFIKPSTGEDPEAEKQSND